MSIYFNIVFYFIILSGVDVPEINEEQSKIYKSNHSQNWSCIIMIGNNLHIDFNVLSLYFLYSKGS